MKEYLSWLCAVCVVWIQAITVRMRCTSTQNGYNNVGSIVVGTATTPHHSTQQHTTFKRNAFKAQYENEKFLYRCMFCRSLCGWCVNIRVQVTQVNTCFFSACLWPRALLLSFFVRLMAHTVFRHE